MPPPPNTTPASDEDPFGGLDPMAWLESLARRQGANPDELTTAADIDVPLPPPDAKESGPGYTPYDTGSSKPAPEPAPRPMAAPPAPEPAAEDPFGGMDPMAWLESLAKRQGANPDELTTKADLDIPLPPAGAVETGPGYTPGYEAGPRSETIPPPASAPTPMPPRPAPRLQPPAPETIRLDLPQPPPNVAAIPAAALFDHEPAKAATDEPKGQPEPVSASDDPLGGMDPLAWLESLAKRQGANIDELTTAADLDIPVPEAGAVETGPGYTPGYDLAPKAQPVEATPKAPEPARSSEPPRIPVTAPPPVIPTAPPPNAVPAAASLAVPTPAAPEISEPVEPLVPVAASDDPLSGMDPLAWLEALAKRQGAKEEELVTGGTADVPPPPSSAVVNEPGYSDYSPFGNPPLSTELEAPSTVLGEAEKWFGLGTAAPADREPSKAESQEFSVPEPAPVASAASQLAPQIPEFDLDDPIKWLDSLSSVGSGTSEPAPASDPFAAFVTRPGGTLDSNSTLDWLEQMSLGAQPEPESTIVFEDASAFFAPEPAKETVDQGGLSNDPNELLAWLNKQAEQLEEFHSIEDPDAPQEAEAPVSGELAPGELPDWLQGQITVSAAPEGNALVSEVVEPPIPAEMPNWLVDSVANQDNPATLDLEKLLAQQSGAPEETPSEASLLSTSEIAALTGPTTDEVDPWADALDEEFARNKAGDVSIPDWYLEAIERNGVSAEESLADDAFAPPVPAGEAIETVGIEDWLKELEAGQLGDSGGEAAEAVPDLSDLRNLAPAEPLSAEAIPDWMLAIAPDAALTTEAAAPETPNDEDNMVDQWAENVRPGDDLPAWMVMRESVAPPPEPPVRPTTKVELDPGIKPPPPPTRTDIPVTPPAHGSLNPARSLAAARELIDRSAHLESLTHLEPLIDGGHELDAVIGELHKVVAAQPKSPRARRLLGDAFMRKGRLQDALDTYRSALDQL